MAVKEKEKEKSSRSTINRTQTLNLKMFRYFVTRQRTRFKLPHAGALLQRTQSFVTPLSEKIVLSLLAILLKKKKKEESVHWKGLI